MEREINKCNVKSKSIFRTALLDGQKKIRFYAPQTLIYLIKLTEKVQQLSKIIKFLRYETNIENIFISIASVLVCLLSFRSFLKSALAIRILIKNLHRNNIHTYHHKNNSPSDNCSLRIVVGGQFILYVNLYFFCDVIVLSKNCLLLKLRNFRYF